MSLSSNEAAEVLAKIVHTKCVIHSFFLDSVYNHILKNKLISNTEDETYFGIFGRLVAHFHSLIKLDHKSDFQVIAAASRSLFEITIDLTLLTLDSSKYSTTQLSDWEWSAKLQRADSMIEYYNNNPNLKQPDFYAEVVNFVNTKGLSIRGKRRLNKNNQPHYDSRWTGRNLLDDAKEANKLTKIFNFEEFYIVRHAPLCWNTHGSGLTSIRFASEENFSALVTQPLDECIKFSLISLDFVFKKFNISNYFQQPLEDNIKIMDMIAADIFSSYFLNDSII